MTLATHIANFVPAAANSSQSRGPRIHTYRSADAHGDIDAPGYFNSVRKHLKVGDLIYHVQVSNIDASNEAVTDASFFVVTSVPAPGSNVVVSNETAITVTPGS